MSDPREHLGRVRRQFTRQADAYSDMPQTNDAARAEALAAFTGVQPHHDVLDVACGPGFLTAALATRCGRALGVDATPALIERAQAGWVAPADAGSLAEALELALQDPAARERAGQRARELAETELAWSRLAVTLADFYGRVRAAPAHAAA